MNNNTSFLNVGSIHDIPVGKGMHYTAGKQHIAIYRETYGHFYIFADERSDSKRGLHQGRIKDGKICLPNGHTVDVHTGQLDTSQRFFRSIVGWVENGFILLSLSSLLIA